MQADDPNFGPLAKEPHSYGFFLHPVLVLDAASMLPYGFSDAIIWNRDSNKGTKSSRYYHQLPIQEKESCRWYLTAQHSSRILPSTVRKTMVGDRENDVYEVMHNTLSYGCDYLIRSLTNRKTDDNDHYLDEALSDTPLACKYEMQVRGKHGRKNRTAIMELRYCKVTLCQPEKSKSKASRNIETYCIHVKEDSQSVPAGEKAIEWRLLTSHVVETIDQALTCVNWYKKAD